jgi:hypothetical protein
VRDRDARVGRRRDRRGDAVDDLERHSRGAQRLCLLVALTEDERVAAVHAHHPLAFAGLVDQQGIDLILRDLVQPGLCAGVDQYT